MTSSLQQFLSGRPDPFVPGYRVLARAWDDLRTIFFSAEDLRTGARVLIKVPRSQHPSAQDLEQLRRDYEIGRSIEAEHVVKPLAHLAHEGGQFVILDDDGSRPIAEALDPGGLSLLPSLEFGVKLASAVESLHRFHIIHRNINPYSVWLRGRDSSIRITDFSLASNAAVEGPRLQSASRLEGDLRYISPEQTGRVNRAVDFRSDLYSVGVLMYQMLLGAPPFDSQDVLEVMHAHLARIPPEPHALNPAIPQPVSDIVMKLLSKAADERYQSTRGLKADLEECLSQWRARGTIVGLAVGERDTSASFRVSRKLYGRGDQLDFLLESFDRVCRGKTEVIVVSGPPGVGKSQLVKALQGRVHERGSFISSKFDQFKKNEPYSFIVQAFTELVAQILAEHDQRISHWKQRLTDALGPNAKVITEVIPEVELIIGPQPPLPELPPREARNRFNRVLRQFVRVFAREDHPCSIFLDDLQWVDSASLNLVKILATDPEVTHLQLIGAYRDTEVGDSHEVMLTLNQLRVADVEVRELRLTPLDIGQVTDLLVDTLGCELHEAHPLAELVHQKTGGNPFFVNQFLLFLQQDELIQFDYRAGKWAWDLRRIWALGITDDVVDLMNRKLSTLPASTREALKVAACLGNRFNLVDIAVALEESVHVAFESVLAAMREGLIVAADGDDAEGVVGERGFDRVIDDGSLRDAALRFLHDRVQQAAYALIPPDERPQLHFKIGKLLLASLSEEQRAGVPFAILDNLNYGADLLRGLPEREEMAKLNLLAGQRARESTAYQAALAYFRSGMRLLDDDSWSKQYELAMALHIERFECAYMTGSYEEANSLFRDVIANARTKPEKAKAYYLKILLTTSLDRSTEALALGFEGLRLFGRSLPANPSKLHLLLEMCKVIALLRGRRASDLLLLPRMSDPDRQATISLFMSICPPAYFRNTDLMALSALKIMSMSVRYGNTSVSPYGYAIYGLVRGAVFGDYKTGHEFGQLAAKLAEEDGDVVQRCKVLLLFWGFVNYWRRPVEGSVSMLRETLKLAVDCGELQYANYCILQIIFLSLARGANLDEVYAECTSFESFVKQTNDGFTIASHWIRKRGVLALKGSTLANDSLSDEEHSEDSLVEKWRAVGNLTTLSYYYIVKLQLGYLFGNYSSAYRFAQVSEAQIKEALSQICVAEHYFYWGLTSAALIRKGTHDRSVWRRVARCCAKLRHFALNCPENFEHQYLLLQAEVASLRGRTVDCERLYDRAIASAQSQGFSHVEGSANELAAHHYLKTKRAHIARVYFQAARAAFSRWGATAKVKQLDVEFQNLLIDAPLITAADAQPKGMATPPALSNLIDLDLLMKASAELSVEIESERLLLRLLRLILESAGAQSGCFVVDEEGQMRVEIACLGDGNQTAVLRALPVDDTHLSGQIVRYVLRTGQQLVIDDATIDVRFANCPYIRSARPRSVLCAPLSKNAKVIGALYLENRLTPGAFTAERLPSLRLLSQQAVLAIENASYYRKLKLNNDALQAALHKVEILERVRTHLTKFVPQSLQRLIEANPEQPDLEVHDEDVSIVFLDIAGYTRMSESVDPQQVGTLVETYFSSFLDVINSHRGDVNEVLGDGLMVIFRHPDPTEHPVLAARAALGIRDRTKQLNAALRGTWPPVTINIGINSGIVSLGAKKIQSSLGTRWTYAATGSVTNLAARIGASATNGAILVSEVTARRMAGRFELLDLGPQRFKGVAKPIAISRIVGESAEQRQ